jgi:hypothetical protein
MGSFAVLFGSQLGLSRVLVILHNIYLHSQWAMITRLESKYCAGWPPGRAVVASSTVLHNLPAKSHYKSFSPIFWNTIYCHKFDPEISSSSSLLPGHLKTIGTQPGNPHLSLWHHVGLNCLPFWRRIHAKSSLTSELAVFCCDIGALLIAAWYILPTRV